MKTSKLILAGLSSAILAMGIMTVMPVQTQPQPASAQQSEKSDGECTGNETAGRCQDKCPLQTDTLLGYDPITHAAICKAAPTGCPYGDSIALGPDCDKHAPTVTTAQPEAAEFQGK